MDIKYEEDLVAKLTGHDYVWNADSVQFSEWLGLITQSP